ncbi:MAG: hypothetical protein MK105_17760 [Crocinitomicaceae bacterium]|nr:hypothetical protein [Crocinitomicaceae bacterium]
MNKTIGIRVTPSTIYYSVITELDDGIEITILDKVNNPKALIIPEQLKFLRNTLCDIINEFKIKKACIRIAESTAQSTNINRVYIEGIIQELFASSTIENYFVGQISNISSNLGIDRGDFKPYAEGKNDFLNIEDWKSHSLEQRESIMAAVSALNI